MRLVTVLFALAVTSPALAADPVAPQPGAGKEKMICKRETPIGSLIPSRKTCLTRSQWAQREKDGNEEARKMVYENQGRPTTN